MIVLSTGTFATGVLVGLGVAALFGALGKAFAEWAKKKWFGQE